MQIFPLMPSTEIVTVLMKIFVARAKIDLFLKLGLCDWFLKSP